MLLRYLYKFLICLFTLIYKKIEIINMNYIKSYTKFLINENNEHYNELVGEYIDIVSIEDRIADVKSYYGLYEKANNDKLQTVLERDIKEFESKLDIFEKITIMWSHAKKNGRHNAIAEYFHSTSLNSYPLIVLYEDSIEDELQGFEDYNLDIEIDHIIGTTLFHELGHAIVDIDNFYIFGGGDNILNFEDEEDYVENFGRDFFSYKKVPDEFKKLAIEFKKKSWIGYDPDYEISY